MRNDSAGAIMRQQAMAKHIERERGVSPPAGSVKEPEAAEMSS